TRLAAFGRDQSGRSVDGRREPAADVRKRGRNTFAGSLPVTIAVTAGLAHGAHVFIAFDDDRASDSPFIERVWHCHSERGGTFVSVASSHWEIVVTRLRGQAIVTLRGPETRPTEVPCPADGQWLAIRF